LIRNTLVDVVTNKSQAAEDVAPRKRANQLLRICFNSAL